MTPAQALAVMLAVRPLLGAYGITGVDGLLGDVGQVSVMTPGGVVPVNLELSAPLPLSPDALIALAARAESQIRTVLAVNETDIGRGFNTDGRGSLVTSSGYRANDGWV